MRGCYLLCSLKRILCATIFYIRTLLRVRLCSKLPLLGMELFFTISYVLQFSNHFHSKHFGLGTIPVVYNNPVVLGLNEVNIIRQSLS